MFHHSILSGTSGLAPAIRWGRFFQSSPPGYRNSEPAGSGNRTSGKVCLFILCASALTITGFANADGPDPAAIKKHCQAVQSGKRDVSPVDRRLYNGRDCEAVASVVQRARQKSQTVRRQARGDES